MIHGSTVNRNFNASVNIKISDEFKPYREIKGIKAYSHRMERAVIDVHSRVNLGHLDRYKKHIL